MPDSLAAGSSGDKLFHISGDFTSTVKTSLVVTSIDSSTQGMSADADDPYWSGNNSLKFYRLSGFFTSTIRSSLPWPSSSGKTACPDENLDVIVIDSGTDKLYHYSSNFTSTIKTSISIAATDSSPQGVTWTGIDALWMGGTGDKAFQQSGRFTSTIKTSIGLSGIDSSVRDIGFNGVDTLWSGDSTNKLYRISGVFTSTIRSSLSGLDSTPRGIETKDYAARILPIFEAPGGSVAFASTATSNIKPLAVSNSVAFDSTVADEAIYSSQTSAVTFGQIIDTNIKVENVGHSVAFTNTGQKVITISVASTVALADANDDSFPSASPANIINLDGTIDNQKFGVANNDILLDHIIGLQTSIRSASVSNSVQFLDAAQNNIKVQSIQSSFALADALSRQMLYSRAVVTQAPFEQVARTTIEVVAGNSITFTNAAVRAATPNNQVIFDTAAIGATSKRSSNTLVFSNIAVSNIVANRAAPASVLFGQIAFARITSAVGTCPTLTTPGFILLQATGVTDLTLKNPEFSNSEELNITRKLNRSRGGTLHSFQAAIWPKETRINFTIRTIKNAKRLEIITFVTDSLGELITFTDQDGRVWTGILSSPEEVTIQQNAGDENYDANFNLAATLV